MQAIQDQWSSDCFYCSYIYDIIHFILCSIRGRLSCNQFRTNGPLVVCTALTFMTSFILSCVVLEDGSHASNSGPMVLWLFLLLLHL